MREIKFRAWDKYNHRWLDLFQLAFAKDGSVMAVNTLDGETYGLHQVDLVEYTGLKDKNGKEIWEGDIITEGFHASDVGFNDSIGAFSWRWGEDWGMIDTNCIEIIGNIYENPELLK